MISQQWELLDLHLTLPPNHWLEHSASGAGPGILRLKQERILERDRRMACGGSFPGRSLLALAAQAQVAWLPGHSGEYKQAARIR